MPTIARINLTPAKIEAARPRESHYRLWDSRVPGLCCRVLTSGAKSFEVHWGSGSKTLGKFPAMTLTAARTQAQAMLADAAENGAPEAARKAKVQNLAEYIAREYGPWAQANRKDGTATVARLESTFAEFLKKPLTDVTPWVVEKWRSKRLKNGTAPATVNRDMTALKACLSKAVEWGFIDVHPLAKVKPCKIDTQGHVRYLTDAEDRRLRKALAQRDAKMIAERESGNRWRAERGHDLMPVIPADGYGDHLTPMVLLAMNTGLRRGELTSLVWADINLPGRMLTVRGGNAKSGRTRHIPLNVEAVDVLKRYRRQHTEGRLFPVFSISTAFTALLEAAGITALRFHDLRHSFASHLVMAGADLYVVKELLGHASIAMTERYAHLAPKQKAAAVALLGVAK